MTSFVRTWITALLPPVATLAGAWALAAGPALEPDGEPPPSATLSARGVQIYECRAKAGVAEAYEWALVAPQAERFDERGRRVGSHGTSLPPSGGCRRDSLGQTARVAHIDDDRFFDKTQP